MRAEGGIRWSPRTVVLILEFSIVSNYEFTQNGSETTAVTKHIANSVAKNRISEPEHMFSLPPGDGAEKLWIQIWSSKQNDIEFFFVICSVPNTVNVYFFKTIVCIPSNDTHVSSQYWRPVLSGVRYCSVITSENSGVADDILAQIYHALQMWITNSGNKSIPEPQWRQDIRFRTWNYVPPMNWRETDKSESFWRTFETSRLPVNAVHETFRGLCRSGRRSVKNFFERFRAVRCYPPSEIILSNRPVLRSRELRP